MVKKIKSDATQSVAQNVIVESNVSVKGEKTEKGEKPEKSKYDKIFDFEKPSIAKSVNELGVYAANSTVFVNIPSQSNGTIEVIDLVGKTIYTSNFSGKSGRVAFEIPNVVYGTYLVKLTSNGKVVNQKVLLTE